MFVGCLNVCFLIGFFVLGKIFDWIGRRYIIMVVVVIFLIGVILMGLVFLFLFLMVGCVVVGIGVGYFFMILLVYVVEFFFVFIRGFFILFFEVFISVGILFGYVFNYVFVGFLNGINWRFMFGFVVLLAIVVVFGVLGMFEFFCWFVVKGRFEEVK